MMSVRTSAIAALVAVLPMPASAAMPVQVLEPVMAVTGGTRIGTLKQGLVCLPKRPLRIGDLGPAGPVANDVAAVIVGQGVAAPVADRSPGALPLAVPTGGTTLTITVTDVAATMCIPAYGIGHAPKGRGTITTLWRLFAADRHELFARSYRTDWTMRRDDPAGGWRDAIMAAARQVAVDAAPLLR